MSRRFLILAAAAALLLPALPASADSPPFELAVKRAQRFGGSTGTLVFSVEAVEYRTADKDDARRWSYEAIKQVQILSPTRIRVLTYEDQVGLRLGADRTFDFTIQNGAASPELVTYLLARIDRPVVTAVMPQYGGEPLDRLRVKHQRQGRGSEGTLALYDRQLVYLTEQEEASRYWRFADIDSVLRLDRFRLQITVYEGGGTRPFVFELKSDLPDGFYDALWARVNPSGLELQSPASRDLAVVGR
ncbi:MAG: hypothetical protein HYU37_00060 [Acidobacteria bacterium]|nr:hypothetical protein [Acidobacteriota bacterium]